MGYKDEIFEEEVDNELRCPICEKVLENPMQGIHCEHLFCLDCIQQWLKNSLICPLDRKQLLFSHLQPPPKIILKLLNNLKIKCDHYEYGCLIKLKLSDLNQHLKNCLYNPPISQNFEKSKKCKFNGSNSSGELKHFRVAGDLSSEINQMNKVVKELNEDFDIEYKKSIEFSENLEIAQQNYENLNKRFNKMVNPFLNLLNLLKIDTDQRQQNSDQDSEIEKEENLSVNKKLIEQELKKMPITEDERQTCTAIVRNLNEFLNEKIVEEYLRQNDILTLSCEQELTIFKRSRDFKVTIYKNDFYKLFSESLWPTGVTCHNLSNKENFIVFGKRQTDLPCLLIKSGLALSYY